MIISMTGFGKASQTISGRKITIEIKSLNGKQLDLNARLHPMFREKEADIRSMVTRRVVRGKTDLAIYVEDEAGTPSGQINAAAARSYHGQVKALAADLGLPLTPELLPALLGLPDVVTHGSPELPETAWEDMEHLIGMALDEFEGFRLNEGRTIQHDIEEGLSAIISYVEDIKPLMQPRADRLGNRIRKELEAYGEGQDLDQNRFAQEMIYYIEKLDLSEEISRLLSHCGFFRNTLDEQDPQGKKLGFIVQEMGREINTIGSKANDATIQNIVVCMKDELEKIREQLANAL